MRSPRRFGTPLYVYSADQIARAARPLSAGARRPRSPRLLRGQSQLRAGDSQAARRARRRASTSSPAANWSACWPPRPRPSDRVVFSGVGKTASRDRPRAQSRHSRVQRGERGGARRCSPRARANSKSAPASRCASIPTSLPRRIPTSPPACASTSSASTSAARSRIYKQRGQRSLARGARRQRPHRLADPLRRPVWRGHRARQQAGAASSRREGIALKPSTPAAASASIITAALSTRPPRSRSTPPRSTHALERFRRPPADRAGPFSRRPGRRAGGARALRQAQRQEDLRHHRCGHERPHPPRALPGISRDCSGAAAGQGSRASSMWWARSASPATFSRATASSRRSSPATWWPCSTPAPTAWRKAPTTTRARAPPKCWSKAHKARLIRRRETIADLLAPEVI